MARNCIPLPATGNVCCFTCGVPVGSSTVPFIHVGSNVRFFGATIMFDRAPRNVGGGEGLWVGQHSRLWLYYEAAF